MPNIQHKRGTRAALDALASSNALLPWQLYGITDESRLAIATSASTYSVVGSGGGAGYYVGPTAPDPAEFPLWFNTEDGAFLVRVGAVWVEPGGGGSGGDVSWDDVLDKPVTFPPAAHTHVINDVTGLQSALDGKQAAGSYLTSESDPVFLASPAAGIAGGDITNWNAAYGWGNHASGGYASAATLTAHIGSGGGAHANATGSVAGFMSAADKTKLDGVAAGATVNATDASLRDRATHTGTQAASTITGLATVATSGSASDLGSGILPAGRFDDTAHGSRSGGTLHAAATGGVAGFMSAADKTKLDGIASGATANTGTVTSVGMSLPTGLQVSGSPITGAGSFTVTYASGYAIPTTASQSNWDTAFGWGNHASAGYLTSAAIGTTVQGYSANLASWSALAPSTKQDALVSGTTIKTVNGESLLGSGNIVIAGGSGGAGLHYGATPPVDEEAFPFWLDTEEAVLYVWYDDGTTGQWIGLVGGSGGGGSLAWDDVTGKPTTFPPSTHGHDNATTSAAGFMSAADKTKLDGIAIEATANATDAALRDRATHTGTQAASTISDFNAAARGQAEAMLVAGANITLTPSGSGESRQITVAATGVGGGSPGGASGQVQFNNAGSFGGMAHVEANDGRLQLVTGEPGSAPPAGRIKLFSRAIAGRNMPAFVGPSGLDSAIQAFLGRNKIAFFNPPGNATTVQAIGMANPTATGTATAANVGTANIHQAMRRLEYAVTTAAATAVAGARVAANQYHIGGSGTPFGGFTFIARFGPSRGVAANATRRFFAGLTSNTGAPTDADPTSGTTWANMIAVVADSADTNFHIAHRTGTGAVTKIDTGIPKGDADNTEMFELALFTSPTGTPSVGYQFTRLSDGVTFSGTITTALPTATTLLTWQIWTSVGGTSAVVGVSVASVYIETDF